jgi:hypothetical protein
VPWSLVTQRAHGRILVLRYDAGGCLHGDGRAVVGQTADRVSIDVREHEDVPNANPHAGPLRACLAIGRVKTLRLRLADPLGGRTLTGELRQLDRGHARPLPLRR